MADLLLRLLLGTEQFREHYRELEPPAA